MNAILPNPGDRDEDSPRRAARPHEPSMEEILASIRAIIADDREAAPRPPTEPRIVYSNDRPTRATSDEAPATDAAESFPPRAEAAAPAPMVVWARPRGEPTMPLEPPEAPIPVKPQPAALADVEAEPRRAPEPSPAPETSPAPEPQLLSEEADRAVAASFHALSATVAMQSAELVDRLTREMLRPMVKSWLDEHLPSLVERLVRAEIQRVARGGR